MLVNISFIYFNYYLLLETFDFILEILDVDSLIIIEWFQLLIQLDLLVFEFFILFAPHFFCLNEPKYTWAWCLNCTDCWYNSCCCLIFSSKLRILVLSSSMSLSFSGILASCCYWASICSFNSSVMCFAEFCSC